MVSALEDFAPLPLQEDYDNAGLQVGLTEAEVSGALLCLDVTEEVIDEALSKGCNLVVSHHPLIFRRLRRVGDGSYVERCVRKAIKNDVTIVSMHTNLDNARGGVNFKMAEILGLTNVRLLSQKNVEGIECGSGVIGDLPEEMSSSDFLEALKRLFHVECVMANELLERGIRRVALCGGAGSFLLGDAMAAGADAFVTGEMGYHEFFGTEQAIQIAVIGHYQSEQFTPNLLEDIIAERCPGVTTFVSEVNTNPILYR